MRIKKKQERKNVRRTRAGGIRKKKGLQENECTYRRPICAHA